MKGGILIFDFHGYFDCIIHCILKEMVHDKVIDPLICHTYDQCIDAFNAPGITYEEQKGLGLGSHVSQISAVSYPNSIDHWIKDNLGIHGYARYNDDGYIMCPDINYLKDIAFEFEKRAAALGISMNPKKFRIVKFGKPFRFLKVRYFITGSGRVVKRPSRDAAVKERHKLRKFKSLLNEGKKPYSEINIEFYSWLCSQNKGQCFHMLTNIIRYYNDIFADFDGFALPKRRKSSQRKRYHLIKAALIESRKVNIKKKAEAQPKNTAN